MTGAAYSDIVKRMQTTNRQTAFHEAVLDLNEAPTPANVCRYLAASRLLEQPSRGKRRQRTGAAVELGTGRTADDAPR
jgi:hypothetical protein